MRSRLRWGIASLSLMTILAGGVTVAAAQGPGHLAALAARQKLRDEVCVAMSDGHISRIERYLILGDAKKILKSEEYAGFKQSLDRLSPPMPAPTRYPTQVAQRKPASTAQRNPSRLAKSSPAAQRKSSPVGKLSVTPTIPADVILPDRVVLTSAIR
jgi:hypothetical protein